MYTLPILLLFLSAGSAPPATLPSPAEARTAAERSLPYLLKSSSAWRDNRACVTCHQVPFALWPLHQAKARGLTVDTKALDGLTSWSLTFCTTNKNKGEFTGGFLSTMVKMVLALEPAQKTDQITKAYAFFVPLIAKKQRPDGSFKEGNFIGVKNAEREGIEVDTMWTVLGLTSLEQQAGKSLPAPVRDTLAKTRQRALDWLKGAKPATRSDWLALRMLVERKMGDAKKADRWRQALLARQNADGGWPYVQGGPSHPLVTGECLYTLAEVGRKETDKVARRAWRFLIATQRKDGSWRSPSRAALGNGNPNKVNDINIHWGTGWAAIGLLHSSGADHRGQ